ncbi:MAG: phosphodiester glycosidase family protein [Bacteroidales bacterium]|nr:phosphodiester glycosidase family protein [Bacteroidales bacterium]MCF8338552.1 phosphodiester glycosidase family protein [Bacteroidales bacterium]
MKQITYFLLVCVILACPSFAEAQDSQWEQINEGLYFGDFDAPIESNIDDSKITVLKIDPEVYSFRLLCAEQLDESKMTLEKWCDEYNLLGAVNAGMFQRDYSTNVGFMKNYDYENNPAVNSSYQSVAAFHPVDSADQPFKIFDIDEQSMENINQRYQTVIQNLRLIKRPGENRWSQQEKKWSEVALGQDNSGNVLFIFSRSPYSMYDFNQILLKLPIDIACAQHLEGGGKAGLYFAHNNDTIKRVGSYETGIHENNDNHYYMRLPNVIGFYREGK